jgi:uncharacterized protein YjdB
MVNRARYGVIGVLLIAGCGSQRHDDDAPAVAISLTPPSVVLPPGGTQRFAAVVTGASDASVVWSLNEGPEAGEIALDGTYTAARVAGTFHVMARALADARKTASATVNVSLVPAPTLSVEPSAADIEPGAMLQLRAIVSGSNDRGVLWSIREGSVGGAVDANGLYIAPATTGLYHVVAASHADASRTASAAISVSAKQAVTVSIDPPAATLEPGGSVRFRATVAGTPDKAVRWSTAEGAAGGTVDDGGMYIAPQGEGTFHVVATARADPRQSASAQANVARGTTAIAVKVDPASSTIPAGATIRYSARVTGTTDPRVIWSIEEGTSGGTIDQSGLYSSPPREGVFHIVATSVADPSKRGIAVATVSSFDLIDHGGDVAPRTRTFALWWGDRSLYPPDVETTAEALLGGLNGSSYFGIAEQYFRGARATTKFAGSARDSSPPPSVAADASMNNIGPAACRALASLGVAPASGDVVVVFGSAGITFPPGSHPYCGWHSWWVCDGTNVPVIYIPNPGRTGGCIGAGQLISCNSASDVANATSTFIVHELMESITDPYITAWFDGNAQELADKCVSSFGCVHLGTMTFQIQGAYSNAIHGCAP